MPRKKQKPPPRVVPLICQVCQQPFMATRQAAKRDTKNCSLKCNGRAKSLGLQTIQGRDPKRIAHGPVFTFRSRAGLTQAQYAAAIGVDVKTIITCEREGRLPGEEELEQRVYDFEVARRKREEPIGGEKEFPHN